MAEPIKLSSKTPFAALVAGDRVVIIRRAVDEPDPVKRVASVPVTVLADAVASATVVAARPINYYGTGVPNVALPTLQSQLDWLFARVAAEYATPAPATAAPAPPAPSQGQVDDTGDTFSGVAVSGFPNMVEYEAFGFPEIAGTVPLTTANAYQSGTRIYLKAISGPRAIGAVGFRVTASGSRPAGAFLTNAEPFTGTTTTAPAPTISNFSATPQ